MACCSSTSSPRGWESLQIYNSFWLATLNTFLRSNPELPTQRGGVSKSIRSGIELVFLYWEQPPSVISCSRTSGVNMYFILPSLEMKNSDGELERLYRPLKSIMWGLMAPRLQIVGEESE